MSPIFTMNTATSWDFIVPPYETAERLEIREQAATAVFARPEPFDVLPPRLWLSHSRALTLARRGKPHVPTPEIDLGSNR